jgi:hypothetical protein
MAASARVAGEPSVLPSEPSGAGTTKSAAPVDHLQRGCAVVVNSGVLAGMRGIVVRQIPDDRCLVQLSGTGPGAYLTIAKQQLAAP